MYNNTIIYHAVIITQSSIILTCMKFISMIAGECKNPVDTDLFSNVKVNNYSDPALEGTNVTLSCPDGYTLKGSDVISCNSDGKWEPSLESILCSTGNKLFYIHSNSNLGLSL